MIACKVLKHQIEQLGPIPHDIVYVEQGLHRTPQKLNKELQQVIDGSKDYDDLLLGYGLCSRSVIGLRPYPHQRMVIPRTDDCIAISMGLRSRYLEEFKKNPGTYYFTTGWVEVGDDPYTEYQKTLAKYGQEIADWTIRGYIKNYRRAVFINTSPNDTEEAKAYTKNFAKFFNLEYDEMDGSLDFLKKLVFGPWDEDFVVLTNGQSPEDEMFQDRCE